MQLPVLRDLQRVLDELAFGVSRGADAAPPPALVVEQVPGLRAALLAGRDWRELADAQRRGQLGGGAAALCGRRVGDMVRGLDFLCDALGEGEGEELAQRQRQQVRACACECLHSIAPPALLSAERTPLRARSLRAPSWTRTGG